MTYKPSEWAIARAERIRSGVKTKYNADIHIGMLLDKFSVGEDISSFCADAEINKATFHRWVEEFKEFALAYDDAKDLAQTWLEQIGRNGLHNRDFNAAHWSVIMRNRCGYTATRKIKINGFDKAKTHNERVGIIHKGMAEGLYASDEIKALTGVISDGAKIDEITAQAADIEMIKETIAKKK